MLTDGQQAQPDDTALPEEALKDPYVLEFLDLKDEYSETDLEEALIRRLETFLLELGGDSPRSRWTSRISGQHRYALRPQVSLVRIHPIRCSSTTRFQPSRTPSVDMQAPHNAAGDARDRILASTMRSRWALD